MRVACWAGDVRALVVAVAMAPWAGMDIALRCADAVAVRIGRDRRVRGWVWVWVEVEVEVRMWAREGSWSSVDAVQSDGNWEAVRAVMGGKSGVRDAVVARMLVHTCVGDAEVQGWRFACWGVGAGGLAVA